METLYFFVHHVNSFTLELGNLFEFNLENHEPRLHEACREVLRHRSKRDPKPSARPNRLVGAPKVGASGGARTADGGEVG